MNLKDRGDCRFRKGGRCDNNQVAEGSIVDEGLQSRWFCSQCEKYEPKKR